MLRLVRKDCSSNACCARSLAFHKTSCSKGVGWISGVEGGYGETSGLVLAITGVLRTRWRGGLTSYPAVQKGVLAGVLSRGYR
jgi:hypothetical protein